MKTKEELTEIIISNLKNLDGLNINEILDVFLNMCTNVSIQIAMEKQDAIKMDMSEITPDKMVKAAQAILMVLLEHSQEILNHKDSIHLYNAHECNKTLN